MRNVNGHVRGSACWRPGAKNRAPTANRGRVAFPLSRIKATTAGPALAGRGRSARRGRGCSGRLLGASWGRQQAARGSASPSLLQGMGAAWVALLFALLSSVGMGTHETRHARTGAGARALSRGGAEKGHGKAAGPFRGSGGSAGALALIRRHSSGRACAGFSESRRRA